MFDPTYTITPKLATLLMQIAALKEGIDHMPISPTALAYLRATARIKTIHYSMQMSGNRLSLEQIEELISRERMFNRTRDACNVPLNAHQRALLSLFAHQAFITTKEVETFFKLKPRTARYLCQQWVAADFLIIANASKKKRSYVLAPRFRDFL